MTHPEFLFDDNDARTLLGEAPTPPELADTVIQIEDPEVRKVRLARKALGIGEFRKGRI